MNGWVLVLIWVLAGAATLFVVFGCNDQRQQFMIECQNDGLKHYQCVSLWNGAGLPVFRSRDMLPLN